jgi:hypothetical protein
VTGAVDDGHGDRLVVAFGVDCAERVEQSPVAFGAQRLVHSFVDQPFGATGGRQVLDDQVLVQESAGAAEREGQTNLLCRHEPETMTAFCDFKAISLRIPAGQG